MISFIKVVSFNLGLDFIAFANYYRVQVKISEWINLFYALRNLNMKLYFAIFFFYTNNIMLCFVFFISHKSHLYWIHNSIYKYVLIFFYFHICSRNLEYYVFMTFKFYFCLVAYKQCLQRKSFLFFFFINVLIPRLIHNSRLYKRY